ncbi:hypothetical protein PR048_024920 [Dryococelus australis]|uniref:Uncharacterized protein n=1 Tax=Dryococelus australis TaxID=614101 RepID=A0ABQ9GQ07_9NEOP|nr:hypothetical protein PR048_024920 [Dryococelus australis]
MGCKYSRCSLSVYIKPPFVRSARQSAYVEPKYLRFSEFLQHALTELLDVPLATRLLMVAATRWMPPGGQAYFKSVFLVDGLEEGGLGLATTTLCINSVSQTRDEMKDRIRVACRSLPAAELHRGTQSARRRTLMCFEQGGTLFEHLLPHEFWYLDNWYAKEGEGVRKGKGKKQRKRARETEETGQQPSSARSRTKPPPERSSFAFFTTGAQSHLLREIVNAWCSTSLSALSRKRSYSELCLIEIAQLGWLPTSGTDMNHKKKCKTERNKYHGLLVWLMDARGLFAKRLRVEKSLARNLRLSSRHGKSSGIEFCSRNWFVGPTTGFSRVVWAVVGSSGLDISSTGGSGKDPPTIIR